MAIQRYRQPDTCNGVDMIAHLKGKWVRYGALRSREGQLLGALKVAREQIIALCSADDVPDCVNLALRAKRN